MKFSDNQVTEKIESTTKKSPEPEEDQTDYYDDTYDDGSTEEQPETEDFPVEYFYEEQRGDSRNLEYVVYDESNSTDRTETVQSTSDQVSEKNSETAESDMDKNRKNHKNLPEFNYTTETSTEARNYTVANHNVKYVVYDETEDSTDIIISRENYEIPSGLYYIGSGNSSNYEYVVPNESDSTSVKYEDLIPEWFESTTEAWNDDIMQSTSDQELVKISKTIETDMDKNVTHHIIYEQERTRNRID